MCICVRQKERKMASMLLYDRPMLRNAEAEARLLDDARAQHGEEQ